MKWNVPVMWQMYGTIEGIEASTFEEAVKQALTPHPFFNGPLHGLPKEKYVDDSIELNELLAEDEDFDKGNREEDEI